MKLIVGLGNPGRKYEPTRHNIGFIALSKVASLTSASPSKVRFEGEFADTVMAGEKVGLLWPQTYMNASGQSVRKAVDFFKLDPDQVLVISDDLDLEVGRLKMKRAGSAGGQKGIADIIRHLQSEDFPRLKIGIGRPPQGWQTSDYVLGKFSTAETDKIEEITTLAAHAAIDWVSLGTTETMNRHNSAGKPKKKPQPRKSPKSTAGDHDHQDSQPKTSPPPEPDPPELNPPGAEDQTPESPESNPNQPGSAQ